MFVSGPLVNRPEKLSVSLLLFTTSLFILCTKKNLKVVILNLSVSSPASDTHAADVKTILYNVSFKSKNCVRYKLFQEEI
jgi:hypothetical protein